MQSRPGGLQAVRRALAYLRRYRREAVGAVVALLLVAAANLATPQLIRVAIDVGFTQAQPSVLAEAVAGLVALAFVRGLFTFLQGYLAERASQGWPTIADRPALPGGPGRRQTAQVRESGRRCSAQRRYPGRESERPRS
jgi:hypothetical protein